VNADKTDGHLVVLFAHQPASAADFAVFRQQQMEKDLKHLQIIFTVKD